MPTRKQTTSRAPTAVDQMVGDKIRKLRLDRNMTLAELGTELGISHQQLQKYETGTNRLSAGMLSNVADVLRVSIEDLFEDTTSAKSGAPNPVEKARNECHAWINRTSSVEKLASMARVLKALSAD
ncbi:MAG: helix-turn-helix transcriptional regulator [Hyphomonas sp.]